MMQCLRVAKNSRFHGHGSIVGMGFYVELCTTCTITLLCFHMGGLGSRYGEDFEDVIFDYCIITFWTINSIKNPI